MNLKQRQAIDQALRHLATAVSTSSLYGAEHRQVINLGHRARKCLQEGIGAAQEVSLVRVDEQIAIDGQPLASSLYLDRFARFLKMRGIGHIKFLVDVTDEEINELIAAIGRRDDVMQSSEHIRYGRVEVRFRGSDAGQGGAKVNMKEASELLGDVSGEELARVMEVYEAVSRSRKIQVVGLSEIVAEFIDIFSSYADPMLTLVPLRSMDEYTFTHSLNVCLLNLAQATSLGIEGALLHDIGLSAMLHDVGKLFIPSEILNKPEPLNEDEWVLMREHPVKGAEYLLDTPGVPRMAVLNAYEHHMRFDLRGYPKVREGWKQNLCSQLTAISDIYDSLRTKRPYREPIEVEAVLINIEQLMGAQLHPLLVENFLRLMKKVEPDTDL